ncbi:unnamed protein product [Urochloa humidicola]
MAATALRPWRHQRRLLYDPDDYHDMATSTPTIKPLRRGLSLSDTTTCKFNPYYNYIPTPFDTDEANDAGGRLLRLMDTDEAMITPTPPLLHRHHHTCMEDVKRRPKTTTTAA